MKNIFYKSLLAACSFTLALNVSANILTYDFSLGGFSGGGTVTGSFTGQDLNNDGYLSSFIFSNPVDFAGNPFSAELSEVTSATATFNGAFDAGEFGGGFGTVNNFTITNDLEDLSDVVFGAPNDLFFVLNLNLSSGKLLGDDLFEGLLISTFDQSFVFGAGPFLPAPPGTGFGTSVPAGGESFDIINGLLGGSTLTSGILGNQSAGTPCAGGGACGVVHSVFLDSSFVPNIGGFDQTNQLIDVTRVSEPATLPLLGAMLSAMIVIRLKNAARV